MLQYNEFSPLLGKIIDVITVDSRDILSVQEYYGKVFVSHFNAFVINNRGVVSAIAWIRFLTIVKNNFIPSENVHHDAIIYYY